MQHRPPTRAVLLVDADNFHEERWLEAAQVQLQQACGKPPLIRAYGAPALLQARSSVWGKFGAETIPNLVLEKNTTDAALVADAAELCLREGFRLLAIASGDADFAPLAIRLRRWGCEVWCFANAGKLFQGAHSYYDKVQTFEVPPAVCEVPQPQGLALSQACAQGAALAGAGAAGQTQSTQSVPSPSCTGNATPAKKSQPVPAASTQTAQAKPSLDAAKKAFRRQVFKAVPLLAQCKPLTLSSVVGELRSQGVIGKNEKLNAWVQKFGAGLELTPKEQPNIVTYRHTTPLLSPSPALAVPAAVSVQDQSGEGRVHPQDASFCEELSLAAMPTNAKMCVADVLLTAPGLLKAGQWIAVSDVTKRLCAKGWLVQSQSALPILQRYPRSFELDVHEQYVRYADAQ